MYKRDGKNLAQNIVVFSNSNLRPLVVYVGFLSKTYKSTGIGECTGVPKNYSIFKLKRYRI